MTFIAAQKLDLLLVSDATIAEIRFGIEQVTDAVKRAELNDWLAHKLRPMFAQRTLPITEVILLKARPRGRGGPQSRPHLLAARI